MIISFGTIELRVFSIIKGQYNLNEDLNEVTVYFVMISIGHAECQYLLLTSRWSCQCESSINSVFMY